MLWLRKESFGSVVALVLLRRGYMAFAAFGEHVELCSLLANFVILFVPRPQRWLYKYQIDAEGYVMACRARCGHWQTYFDAFLTVFSKSDFSLFVLAVSIPTLFMID